MSRNRRWLAPLVVVVLLMAAFVAVSLLDPGAVDDEATGGRSLGHPDVEGSLDDRAVPRADGGLDELTNERGGSDRADRDPQGQDQSTEGRTDGAVPIVAAPYRSPTDDVEVLEPAELRRRRLEQVALIETSIADLDRQIAESPGTPHRISLLARREHLEARRAELLSVVLQER